MYTYQNRTLNNVRYSPAARSDRPFTVSLFPPANLLQSAWDAGENAGGEGIRGGVGGVAGVTTAIVGSPFVGAGVLAEAFLPYGEGHPTAVQHADTVYQEHGKSVKKCVDFADSITGGVLGPAPGAAAGLAANAALLPVDLAKFTWKVGTGVFGGLFGPSKSK